MSSVVDDLASDTEVGAAVAGAWVLAVSVRAVGVKGDGVGEGASAWSLAAGRGHPCPLALPPRPDLTLDGVAAFTSVERAGSADEAGNVVSCPQRSSSPLPVSPAS